MSTSWKTGRPALLLSGFSLLLCMMTIAILAIVYLRAKHKLTDAAGNLRAIGTKSISYTAEVNDTIPLETTILIPDKVNVGLSMELRHPLRLKMSIPFQTTLQVPVNLSVHQSLRIDTTLELPDALALSVSGHIPVDQKFQLPGLGNIKLRIKASIPVNQPLIAKLTGSTRFRTAIPVQIQIVDTLPIALKLTVPVDQVINLNMAIKSQAQVRFPTRFKISGKVPIHLRVPVLIPIASTPLKNYLDKTADDLNDFFPF